MDVINKPKDGYTLLFNHTGASLAAVAPEGEYKQYSHGWKTLDDMLKYAKENPGKVRYSTVFGSTTDPSGRSLVRRDIGR